MALEALADFVLAAADFFATCLFRLNNARAMVVDPFLVFVYFLELPTILSYLFANQGRRYMRLNQVAAGLFDISVSSVLYHIVSISSVKQKCIAS